MEIKENVSLLLKFNFNKDHIISKGDRHGRDCMMLDLQLPVQSVPIITKVVSSNPVHGEVYSIQHYLIIFVSDL